MSFTQFIKDIYLYADSVMVIPKEGVVRLGHEGRA